MSQVRLSAISVTGLESRPPDRKPIPHSVSRGSPDPVHGLFLFSMQAKPWGVWGFFFFNTFLKQLGEKLFMNSISCPMKMIGNSNSSVHK